MEYRPRRHYERLRIHPALEGDSLTEQSHGPACDINTLIARHMRAGGLPPPSGQYLDVTRLQAPLQERIAFAQDLTGRVSDVLSQPPAVSPPPEAPSPPE